MAGKCKEVIHRQRERVETLKTRNRTMEKQGGEKGESGGKKDKAGQVLIGERPGGECQRYLLSQRGLRCEARLSRGPERCEVIMGKRGGRQRHLDGRDTERKKDRDRESECGDKACCWNNGRVGRNNRLRWIK